MRKLLIIASVAALAAPVALIPTFAAARDSNYGTSDPCSDARRSSANKGTLLGAGAGALAGGLIAGHGNKLGGALIGGAAGSVIGHQVGMHNVKWSTPPSYYRPRDGCRWVEEKNRGFEVCRGPDGVWRPSDRR